MTHLITVKHEVTKKDMGSQWTRNTIIYYVYPYIASYTDLRISESHDKQRISDTRILS